MHSDSDEGGDFDVIAPFKRAAHPTFNGNEDRPDQAIRWEKVEYFGGDDVPQTTRLANSQIENHEGGFVFKISDAMRVRRFLILGTSGGTFYAKEQEMKLENVAHLLKMINDGKSVEILKELYDVNKSNRAPKMGPLIFCLAVIVRNSDRDVQFRAFQMLPQICRIPTHLFEFISACRNAATSTKISWGRMARKNLEKWYLSKDAMTLAMAVTKYQQRVGWSHRDVIRLAHPNAEAFRRSQVTLAQLQLQDQPVPPEAPGNPPVDEHNDILLYCVKGLGALCSRYPKWSVVDPPVEIPPKTAKSVEDTKTEEHGDLSKKSKEKRKKRGKATLKAKKAEVDKTAGEIPLEQTNKEFKPPKIKPVRMRFIEEVPNHLKFLQGVEDLKCCHDEVKASQLIERFGFVREHVPSRLLSSVSIWRSLLQKMPMTAMIRNLGKMSSVGLLTKSDNAESSLICQKLRDVTALKSARVHPLALLMAQAIYKAGKGDRGNLTWTPNSSILAALDEAFYSAFVNVQSTGRRFLLALDVSGSMTASLGGSCLSCREATAALAMVALRTEPVCEVVGFQERLLTLSLTKTDTLAEAMGKISDLPFGGTDCALPMLWAAQQKKSFDCFVVYTDNETYFGDVHPFKALQNYRRTSGIKDAKLIVVGMTATNFTIADPDDPHMMDIVGFDASTPQLMSDFVSAGFEGAASAGAEEPNN